jgi:hypothetical protein
LCNKIPQSCHTPYILEFFSENYTPYIKERWEYVLILKNRGCKSKHTHYSCATEETSLAVSSGYPIFLGWLSGILDISNSVLKTAWRIRLRRKSWHTQFYWKHKRPGNFGFGLQVFMIKLQICKKKRDKTQYLDSKKSCDAY